MADELRPSGVTAREDGNWLLSNDEYERLRRRGGVTMSLTIEALPVGDLLQNGREVGAYIWGFWNRHLRELPDGWHGTIELDAGVKRDHLAAALTTLVQAGANASIHTDNGDVVYVRFFADVAPAP